MRVTIDRAGRIVIPKKLCECFSLRPNSELEILERPGGLSLRVADRKTSLAEVAGLLAHQGEGDGAGWDLNLTNIREERLQGTIGS
jgi:AbrB family looped-hinge helix DNA binding protein